MQASHNMESFLQSTSAHGVAHLRGGSTASRVFWGLVCCGAYLTTFYAIGITVQNYLDPTNLKTDVTLIQEKVVTGADGKNKPTERYV